MEIIAEQTENIAEMAKPKKRPTAPKTKTSKSQVFKSKKLPKLPKRRK
jgi:hypothetical protein